MDRLLDADLLCDFSEFHEGEVYLTHRWQKHVHQTSTGAILVPVHHVRPGADIGVTHMYRKDPDTSEFELQQTLSAAESGTSGDLNAGIIVEDSHGNLYATGHSIPIWWKWNRIQRWYNKLPHVNSLEKRTNLIYTSQDDGKTWEVLKDETNHAVPDCPHPHNLYFDAQTGQLWWLVGHDGVRLWTYDIETQSWTDRYTGSLIETQDRLPLAMARSGERLWLACEVGGPDARQLLYSDDGGNSWENIDHEFVNPPRSDNDGLWKIAADRSRTGPDTLYVAGGRTNTGKGFVSKSTDNGDTWELVYSGEDRSDTWVNLIEGILFVADGPGPLRYSIDDGATFNRCFEFGHGDDVAREFVEGGIVEGPDDLFIVGKTELYRASITKSE